MRSTAHYISYLIATLTTVSALASSCYAQEVASLDLTKVTGRIDLRRPKATSPATRDFGGTQRTGCFGPTHKTGALQATIVSLDRTHYQLEDEPRFEVTLENTGSGPISIPFSPHLADLQPENPGQKFDYSELEITLWIASGDRWSTNSGGFVTGIYGAEGHKGTMVPLNPGEWVRIIGKGHLSLEGEAKRFIQEHPADQLYATASIYRAQTLITATQSATVETEICIEQTHGSGFPIELTIP